jgi:hypothetical protein
LKCDPECYHGFNLRSALFRLSDPCEEASNGNQPPLVLVLNIFIYMKPIIQRLHEYEPDKIDEVDWRTCHVELGSFRILIILVTGIARLVKITIFFFVCLLFFDHADVDIHH